MSTKIGDCIASRDNNFDIIRLVAALAVIYSHSYTLTAGSALDPIERVTGKTYSFGGLSVAAFFVISGLLITMSFKRASGLHEYFSARALRIFPALIFVVFFTVFVLGPVLTSLPPGAYFKNGLTYKYLFNITALRMQYHLPGVLEHNYFGNIVNGSLWTLPQEVLCYFIVALIGSVINKKFVHAAILFVLITFAIMLDPFIFLKVTFYWHASFFLCGALAYVFRDKIVLNGYIALLCFITASADLLFIHPGNFNLFFFVPFFTYLLLNISFIKTRHFKSVTKYGDFSYGIYVWGFLTQQVLCNYFPNITQPVNFILAAVICVLCGVFSWHFIEKKALLLKKYIYKKDTVNKLTIQVISNTSTAEMV